MTSNKVDTAAFKQCNKLLKRYQAYAVERTLTPDSYDNGKAIEAGKQLIAVVEKLPKCLVHFVDGGLQRMDQPHVVFSKTDLCAVLIDKSRLSEDKKDPHQARIVELPLVEKLEPLQ